MNPKWLDDRLQFARLLCEIVATQDIDVAALCDSMDLTPTDIDELLDRAHAHWEAAKRNPTVEVMPDGEPRLFTNVGCYPIFYVGDGECFCPKCALKTAQTVVGTVNWEDPDLYCDDCEERIESAYAKDDQGDNTDGVV